MANDCTTSGPGRGDPALEPVGAVHFPNSPAKDDIRRLDFIDALRGYAILGVILVHSSQSVTPKTLALGSLAARGATGVQLFYVASALTLCLSWQVRRSVESRPLRNFYLRRFFRIAPLFYLAIAGYSLVWGFAPREWAPDGVKWWYLPITALFLNGFNPETINSVVPGGWSIAVESSFYAVFPLMMHWVRSLRHSVLLLTVSVCMFEASKAGVWALFGTRYPGNEQYLVATFSLINVVAQMPVFAIGVVTYFLLGQVTARKHGLLLVDAIVVAIVGLMFSVKKAALIPSTSLMFATYLGTLALFGLLTLSLAAFPIRLLVNRYIGFIGKISYSMYLTHFAVLAGLHRVRIDSIFKSGDLSSFLYFFVIVVATAAAVSCISYTIIEKPGIELGKRIIGRLETVALGTSQLADARKALGSSGAADA